MSIVILFVAAQMRWGVVTNFPAILTVGGKAISNLNPIQLCQKVWILQTCYSGSLPNTPNQTSKVFELSL